MGWEGERGIDRGSGVGGGEGDRQDWGGRGRGAIDRSGVGGREGDRQSWGGRGEWG